MLTKVFKIDFTTCDDCVSVMKKVSAVTDLLLEAIGRSRPVGNREVLEQQIDDLPLVRPVPADHRLSLLEHLTDKVHGHVIDAAVNTRLTDTD